MTTRSCLDKLHRRGALLTMAAALAMSSILAGPALAQSNVASMQEGQYSLVDLSLYFGTGWYQIYQGEAGRPLNFKASIITGGRLDENIGRYFSIEEGLNFGWNQAQFLPVGFPQGDRALLKEHNTQANVLAVLNLTPRDHAIRPFFVFGPEATWFAPAATSSFTPAGIGIIAPSGNLKTSLSPGFVYGVGLKSDINRHLAVRIDLRGVYGEQPHFGITANPGPVGSIFVPSHGSSSGLEFTSGIVFRFGLHEPPPVVVAAPPPPAPRAIAHPTISAITGAHDVCPGDDLRLSVSSSGWLPDTTPSYQWYVNNTAASGGTGTSFSVPTGGGAGSRAVKVTASVGDATVTSNTVNVNIKNDAPPTIQFSVSPTTIAYGDKLPLAAQARGSECGNPVTVRYSASEGSISGTTFDSSGVSMDMNNRLNRQSKAVRLTATVTDAKNRTASAPATVNVTLTPQAKRLDDIVFQNNSARVNNCGKRLLLEELTPMLRNDPNAKVILIGHRDNGERVALKLDENRTLNAAAILSAGKGICPSLDLSRILVHYAGTDQSSDTRPALCGSSTTERSGQAVRDSDKRAQFRRVEVWIVPGGADMPAGTSGYTAAPERETKAKACPR